MRYAFIKRHQKAWPITLMCRVLEVSKTGYYDWGKRCPGVRAASNQALDNLNSRRCSNGKETK